MARPLWYVKFVKKTFPNVKLIAKLTKFPILGKVFDKLLFEGDEIIYLVQDKVIKLDKPVGEYDEYVLPSQVLEYFINKANYHWVMNFCICRDSMQCKDYPIKLGCLFLGEATQGINPQLGRRVTKEEALEAWNDPTTKVLFEITFVDFEEYWESCVVMNNLPPEELEKYIESTKHKLKRLRGIEETT